MVKPADRWVKKYSDRTAVALPDYEWGVRNPAVSPIDAAVAKRADLEAKMRAKETWDKWESNLKGVGLTGWQDAAIKKGTARYSPGVEYGKPKFESFSGQFETHLKAKEAEIRRMSTATLDLAIAKAVAQIRHNAAFRFRRGS